jgi:MFS family permease
VVTRGIRAFVDGIAFVVLPAHLTHLGFSATQVGAVVAASLLGSALLTLAAGFLSRQVTPRTLLLATSWIMLTTGIALGSVTTFVPLLLISIVTTLNPSAGDVSPFLPIEQALLSNSVSAEQRTSLFAGYNLVGSLVGALGALCAGLPVLIARSLNVSDQTGRQSAFVFYGLAGLLALVLYSRLPRVALDTHTSIRRALSPHSRKTVLTLSALFSLDSFGGGFATQAIFALWMLSRFNVSIESLGALFFGAGIISAFSSLLAVRISQRIGLVRTMVFTHIPASVLLVLVALSPHVSIAIALFLVRAFLSQMDVPVRTSYVMAVVKPEERAAASSITNVPRSLASALPPLAAGWMLDQTTFAWPLLICAACKITYDLLLLKMFTDVAPHDTTTEI